MIAPKLIVILCVLAEVQSRGGHGGGGHGGGGHSSSGGHSSGHSHGESGGGHTTHSSSSGHVMTSVVVLAILARPGVSVDHYSGGLFTRCVYYTESTTIYTNNTNNTNTTDNSTTTESSTVEGPLKKFCETDWGNIMLFIIFGGLCLISLVAQIIGNCERDCNKVEKNRQFVQMV